MPKEWESVFRRAWKDTKKWLPSSFISWIILALIPVVVGVLITLFIAPVSSAFNQVLYGGLGSVATLILVILISYFTHSILSLKRQRNEARKLYEGLYKPTEFLRNIRGGDLIFEQKIDMALLFKQQELLNNITFDHCTLKGPSVIGLIGNTEIIGCKFGGKIENILIKVEPGRYMGPGGLVNCKFLNCTFEKLGFIVTDDVYEMMKRKIVSV